MTCERKIAEPRRSAGRVLGKFCQLLARRAPFLPNRVRVFLQRLQGVNFIDANSVFLGEDVYFDDIYPENIKIGREVVITTGTRILTHYLDTKFKPIKGTPFRFFEGNVVIGDYVFIGINTVIAAPVTIGAGAVIAANSLVTRDVPENAIMMGVPAKQVGERVSVK